jgi:hypothetical protein
MIGSLILYQRLSIRGVVNNPIWDFIEPSRMVFPQLHVKIGLVNNALDGFYLFIDDQVEAPTDEEKCSRNSCIVADVSLPKVVERLDEWKVVDGYILQAPMNPPAAYQTYIPGSHRMQSIHLKYVSQYHRPYRQVHIIPYP